MKNKFVTQEIWEKIYQEGFCISDFLPWYGWEDDVFILVDGSLGKGVLLGQIPVDTKTDEELFALGSNVEIILTRFQPGFSYQFILLSTADVSKRLRKYSDFRDGEGKPIGHSAAFSRWKVQCIEAGRNGFFRDGHTTYSARELALYLFVRYSPEHSQKRKIGNLTPNRIRELVEREKHPLLTHFSDLCSAFKNLNLPWEEVKEESLMGVINRMVNYGRSTPRYNPSLPIREQVFYTNPEVDGEGFILNGVKTSVISLKELPQTSFPGLLTVGRGQSAIVDLSPDLAIVFNVFVRQQPEELGRLKRKSTFAFLHRANALGAENVESSFIRATTDQAVGKLFNEGKKILTASCHFLLWKDLHPAAGEQAENEILNTLHFLGGAEGVKETLIGPSIFLSCLPFCYDAALDKFYKRSHKILSDELTDLLPFWGSWAGTETPSAIFTNRQGRIFYFDPFDSNSPHFALTGITGAGKSVFAENLIMEALRLGSHIFVIDKGASYKRICELNGGQYVEISPNSPTCINPFPSAYSPESLAFLVMLVAEMGSGGELVEALHREERSLIQAAIQKTYVEVSPGAVTLSEVAKRLNEDVLVGSRIANKLNPFLRGGPYGGFFDGPNELNIQNSFVVFEMGGGGFKDLQAVILLALMYILTEKVAKMRDVRKYLFIDEAWTLLNSENTASFLETAFRTFRKYRCSVGAISQQIGDFVRTKAGEAILANAVNRVYLAQNPEVIVKMQKELDLNDAQLSLLQSVRTVKGMYSEAMVKTDSGAGIARLILDRNAYWLFTTDPKDISRLAAAAERYGGVEQGIEALSKETG